MNWFDLHRRCKCWQSYRAQVSAEDIEDLGELDALWKVCMPPKDFHDDMGIGDVEPIPERGDHDESIAHLMMRAISVMYLPCSEVVPCEAVVAQDAGELLDEVDDLTIQ